MFNNLNLRDHEVRIARLVAGGIAIFLVAIPIASVLPISYGATVITLLVLTVLIVLTRWLRPHYRTARTKLDAHAAVRRERLLVPVTPSRFTVKYSGLDDAELATTVYDEPQHWITFFYLFFDPFWRPPEVSTKEQDEMKGWLDRSVIALLRTALVMGQILVTVGLIVTLAGKILAAFGHRFLLAEGGWNLSLVAILGVVAVWCVYVNLLRCRNRFVITSKSMALVIRQLPWRDSVNPTVPIDTYTQHDPIVPVLGKLLGFAHFSIRTSEYSEMIVARMYARRPRKLQAVLDYQRILNQQRATAKSVVRREPPIRRSRIGTGPGR